LLVYHHYRQKLKARGKEIIVEGERKLYAARLERHVRKAMTRADSFASGVEIACAAAVR